MSACSSQLVGDLRTQIDSVLALSKALLSDSYGICRYPNATIDAQLFITQCMRDLDEATTFLKATINTLPSVARLPPEILWHILSFCVLPDGTDKEPAEDTRRLLDYAHISRHWHAAVLGCPRIWSHLTFSDLAWTRTLLRRSKFTPLDVRADLRAWTSDQPDAVAAALGYLHRVRLIDMLAPPEHMERLFALMECAAPVLRSLTLANHSVHLQRLPQTLFGGTAPLRTLKIVDFAIDWAHPLFAARNESGMTALTSLDISNSFPSRDICPTLDQLLDVLDIMPALQNLRLWRTVPQAPDPMDPSPAANGGRVAHLPALRHLALADTVPNCAQTVAHLRIPLDTAIYIECIAADPTDEDFSPIAVALTAHLRTARSGNRLRGLRFSQNAGRCLFFEAWTADGVETPAPDTALLRVHMIWRQWDEMRAGRIVARSCAALPLADAQFALFDRVPMDEWTWRGAAAALPGARTLSVIRLGAESLVNALMPLEPDQAVAAAATELGNAPMPLSRLRHLKLCDVRLGQSELLTALAQCIQLRRGSLAARQADKVNHAWLESVSLDRCRLVGDQGIARLEELGVEVSVVCASPQ